MFVVVVVVVLLLVMMDGVGSIDTRLYVIRMNLSKTVCLVDYVHLLHPFSATDQH